MEFNKNHLQNLQDMSSVSEVKLKIQSPTSKVFNGKITSVTISDTLIQIKLPTNVSNSSPEKFASKNWELKTSTKNFVDISNQHQDDA